MVFKLLKSSISLIIFALLGFSSLVHALDVPSAPSGRVSDYAALLSNLTKQKLEKTLEEFEKTDATQIAVAIFSSLDGDNLEDFSMQLASTWKTGQKGHNNGVVFLIFKNDRQMRIEVGYGLEDKLTDATSSDIIRNVIVPEFKNSNFDAGVTNGTTAIMQAVRGAYLAHSSSSDASFGEILIAMLVTMLFFGFFLMKFISAITGRGYSYSSSGWRIRVFGGNGSSGGFSSGGSSFSGGGGSFGGGGSSGRW